MPAKSYVDLPRYNGDFTYCNMRVLLASMVVPEYGSGSVLETRDREAPPPDATEVSVDIRAAGVNFADIEQRRGRYRGGPTWALTTTSTITAGCTKLNQFAVATIFPNSQPAVPIGRHADWFGDAGFI